MTTAPDGHVWFASPHEGYLGRVSPSGEIREFFLPNGSSQVFSLAIGPDNNLWYTDAYLGRIGCLVLATTSVELQRFSAE
jgi:virginiamycin B lyase